MKVNYENFSIKKRAEIPETFKWDLSVVYRDIADWEEDFAKLPVLVRQLNKLKGTLSTSAENIKQVFEFEDQISLLIEKLSSFARHLSDEDTGNNKNLSLVGKISAKTAEIEAEIAWIDPELLSIEEKKLREFAETPELRFYKKTIEDLIREKEHTLSADEEKILGLVSDALSNSYETFTLLSNADIKFPFVRIEDGSEIEITQSNFITLLRSQNREIRKETFEKYFSRYSEFQNTFASLLDGTIKANVFEAKVRRFKSCLESALFEDKIPTELYNNLIISVKQGLPFLFEYFAKRRRVLRLDEMHIYDLYHIIVSQSERQYSWDEAKELVLSSLQPLGNEYCGYASKAFAERWIDVLPNRGKKSGAYSGGAYGTPPFILLNYNGRLEDLFTLAHELGHSMHSFYSNIHQEYHYSDYSIFLAEIASICSELLLHEYLFKNTDDKNLKALLLNQFIDEFRATVVRQTMFAEFELNIHKIREGGEALTAELLKEEYFRLVQDYFGKEVCIDKLIEIEWARIPHFHYGFYVYKYATGFSAAAKFANKILNEQNGAKEYLKFISSGSSKDVLDILIECGINPQEENFIEDTFAIFADKADQLFKLIK